MTDTVTISRDGAALIVAINRPEARNAVNPETATALHAAFLEFDADETLSVAILTGEGGAFCAGYDLKHAAGGVDDDWFDAHAIRSPTDLDGKTPGPMGPTRLSLSKPVIAAVEGPAVAGGMELAIWCDLRVMAEDAFFGIYCRRWGVPLIDGGAIRLPRLIGQSRALDLLLTGRRVDAEEALSIGLANRTTPSGGALEGALALADQLARFPQGCMRADRRVALEQWSLSDGEAFVREWRSAALFQAEGLRGAGRFAAGKGRSGDFDAI